MRDQGNPGKPPRTRAVFIDTPRLSFPVRVHHRIRWETDNQMIRRVHTIARDLNLLSRARCNGRTDLSIAVSQNGFELVPLVISVGDYVLTPEICVERKSLSDLFQSMSSGRLYNQVRVMA